MTRNQRVTYYENLLLLCAIPFIVVALNEISNRVSFELPKPQQCDIFHEQAPIHLKCQR